ncbi:MAG: histidine phosphatase family protein [Pseudomonadota bacterium]
MRIILMRHGEPVRGGENDPRADFGLTDVGRQQMHAAVGCLSNVDRIIASHLPRSQESARIVADHLGKNVVTDSTVGEIDEAQGEVIETLPVFFQRVNAAMLRLAQDRTVGTTLVVTHAGFIMASIRVLFDIPTPGTGARLEPRFASMTEWYWSTDVWELVSFNVETS